ncbi:MAG: hypothetical protein ACO2YV_01225 [Pseudomonadales bacterium]
MIHRKVLISKGCTAERLRAIFTSQEGEDCKIRKRFEDRIASRITAGVKSCAKNASIWQAVDMAWDSQPIQPETLPLLLWAQRKITTPTLADQLKQIGNCQGVVEESVTRNAAGEITGKEMKVNMPRLYEVSINLIRSYITRRLAAQTARFSNLWPYFRYEPRGVDQVSKLRGDVLSERIDIMADLYNYRHFFPQTFRHQFMYARSVVFVRSAWDRVIGWKAKDLNLPSDRLEIESYIEREGVDFVAPHISRVFWDSSAPLANINTDNGPKYLGYWDIVRYGEVNGTSGYFNLDVISVGEDLAKMTSDYGAFFNYYFDPTVLKWPDLRIDPTIGNDRASQSGKYGMEEKDKGVLVTQYFEKINPKAEGIADLNVDVWLRLAVAGDQTVVAAEFLTSRPAAYGGLNENDDREINASMATELMPFQDQLTNLFSQMLMNIRAGMMQIWAIDKDALEPEMQEYVKTTLKNDTYYTEPKAFFYSGEKLRSLGIQNPADSPRAFLTIIQAQVQTTIEQSMRAIHEVLNTADRVLMFSPNEQGQPNPREVAAREITEISSTTDTIKAFVSDGVDEQRAAVKKIIYESLVCESDQTFSVPVMDRYTAQTIREGGFETKTSFNDMDMVPLKTPIMGKPSSLVFDYYFNSRDGADRVLNSQGATIMAQLLGQLMQVPMIAEAFGKKRLFEWANEIVRMSGAAIDLKLELDDNEPDRISSGDPAALEQRIAKLEAFLQQVMQSTTGGSAPATADTGVPPALMQP